MRTRKKVAALVVASVLSLTLAGCVQPSPHVIPTSEPSTKPVFASDAEALAAAKSAFTAYLSVSDEVAHDGGAQVSRLAPLDSASQFKRDTKSFAEMQAEGHRTVGDSEFSDVALESSEVSNGKAQVVAYICMQIGGTQLLDGAGANVGANRPLAVPLEVSFVSRAIGDKTLLVDRSDAWNGTDFCS
ncbi:MAG: hypothetical protein QOH69_2204 [Actinomycetota bacterium]|jgi:hypothetical protein|nr:hypothetical protein [Actinomycetota bacterium]